MLLILGCAAFGCFFLSDANDLHFARKGGAILFPLGIALLTAATAVEAVLNASPVGVALRIICSALTLVFLILTVYSLFFAIPIKSSYAEPGAKRSCRDEGVYALCRHPGVLFFIPLYLCLTALGLSLLSALVYICLNVLLVVYEDYRVFPVLLEGYDEYKRRVPFLFPNKTTLTAFLRSH